MATTQYYQNQMFSILEILFGGYAIVYSINPLLVATWLFLFFS